MAGKILVATDGSLTANRAVDFAASLSQKFGQDLCVVHVLLHGRPWNEYEMMAELEGVELLPERTETRSKPGYPLRFPSAAEELAAAQTIAALGDQILENARRRADAAGAINVTGQICAGDPADEIIDVAADQKADVLVLGRRGLGRVREVLLGSVSQKVLHHANCVVVIVH